MGHLVPRRFFLLAGFYTLAATFLPGCGPSHRLPLYEKPIARTEFQTVRTTAYTHTESDHVAYGNHNALGGTLRAASRPQRRTLLASAAVPVPSPRGIAEAPGGFNRQPFLSQAIAQVNSLTESGEPQVYGSAAADWSRWPVGTTFRIESTGQIYRVDDYGWALAGRNTIDLYQPSRSAMNAWGVRREPIHVLRWGSREESLRRLRNHQKYRHIRRMVLELEGKHRAAARLE